MPLKENMSRIKDVNNHINGYNAPKHSIYTQIEYYLGFFNQCEIYSGKKPKNCKSQPAYLVKEDIFLISKILKNQQKI